jgi:transcription initiation factor TFIID TATA-box-binding protein
MAALGMSGDAIGVGAARGASAAAVMDAARPVDLARHPSGIVPALQ